MNMGMKMERRGEERRATMRQNSFLFSLMPYALCPELNFKTAVLPSNKPENWE
jgi:hypothetical protein